MNLRKVIKFGLISFIISNLIYFGIAFGLLVSQQSVSLENEKTISFKETTSSSHTIAPLPIAYTARDGAELNVRHYPAAADTAPLVILIHGSGWHGGAYTGIAEFLTASGNFEVLVPDLRGHGPDTKNRGDIAYIGQLEDDLADLIDTFQHSNQKVFMIGHSSGGGLVIRFSGGEYGDKISKAVLLAPFLKYNAPTIREKSGGWAHALTRRIIGLTMLNNLGITQFNDMIVIQFNFPQAVLDGPLGATATRSYSHRLNTSFAPRDAYLADVAALPEFLLIVGADDDAFIAENFEPTLAAATENGRYEILPDIGHLEVIESRKAKALIADFLKE